MNIAILLTIFNRKEITLKCLKQLYKLSKPQNFDYTIFINDDGSTDGSYEAILKNYPEVKIYRSSGNLYWNRGMYRIWDIASKSCNYDGYLWLNDDTILYESAFDDLYNNIEQTNCLSILVGPTNDRNNSTSYSGYDHLENRIVPNGKIQKCYYFNGNFVFIPGSVFKIIGNLEFYYRHSFGDWDYGIKAYKYGINSYVLPNFVGYCERHDKDKKVIYDKSLIERIKYIYSPLGQNPNELFLFMLRKNGILLAVRSYISVIYKIFFKI